jgi:hypothetical protein
MNKSPPKGDARFKTQRLPRSKTKRTFDMKVEDDEKS